MLSLELNFSPSEKGLCGIWAVRRYFVRKCAFMFSSDFILCRFASFWERMEILYFFLLIFSVIWTSKTSVEPPVSRWLAPKSCDEFVTWSNYLFSFHHHPSPPSLVPVSTNTIVTLKVVCDIRGCESWWAQPFKLASPHGHYTFQRQRSWWQWAGRLVIGRRDLTEWRVISLSHSHNYWGTWCAYT